MTPEAVVRRCYVKVLPETCNFIKKETLAQAFSCGFCKIFKNTFFIEHPRTAAPVIMTNGKNVISLQNCPRFFNFLSANLTKRSNTLKFDHYLAILGEYTYWLKCLKSSSFKRYTFV